MTRHASWLVGIVAAAGLTIGSAQANLVNLINGGFETGDFTGWSETGNATFDGVQCPGPGPTVDTGNCSAFFGPIGSVGGISQSFAGLGVGDRFTLTFAFLPDGGNPSSFAASFGGNNLLSLSNPAASATFGHFSFSGVITNAAAPLAFNFRDDPGFLFDSVTLLVPEPATMALLGAGLVGLGFSRRRKAA